ncbi:hypothetical protein [Hymenobacter glacieicola]|uniref:hypothetical protein n=1 Tax=Hymenobacter glacieicola TaxID=1562124 RepID=UPI00166A6B3A|nr:hypothetical protein [Hymenobacter glacieicola]
MKASDALKDWASSDPEMMMGILRKAELARTNNFDLLQADGWQTLLDDISEDFSYLSLQELNGIIKAGYKGELDKYKNLALNFPRVYQWVKQNAPRCLSYWHHYHAAPMRFAQLLEAESLVMEYIRTQPTPPNDSLLRTGIKQIIERTLYEPYKNSPQAQDTPHPRLRIQAHQYAQWEEEYPAYAARHGASIF